MKTWAILTKLFIAFGLTSLVIYCAILFLLPYFLNKKDYSHILTEALEKNTGLVLLIKNYNLSVAPNLDFVFSAKGIQLFYPDKKQIADIKDVQIGFSTFDLLKKEIKLNKISASEFQFSTKLLKNGKTTLMQYLDNKLIDADTDFKFSKSFPKTKIAKYIVKIKDEESNQKFKLQGKDFELSQNYDYRYLNLRLIGEFYCSNKKYLTYNSTFFVPKLLFKDFHKSLFDINFENLYKQDFSAKLHSELKIHTHNDKFDYVSGFAKVDDFVIKLGESSLPPSYFHITADKGVVNLIAKLHTQVNEHIDVNAKFKTKKTLEMDVHCKCKKAELANLQRVASPILSVLKIKNNFNDFRLKGIVNADFKVHTDSKNIKSSGEFNIINASLVHKTLPFRITDANADIDFSNNKIRIIKSDFFVNGQPTNASGTINTDATADLIFTAKNLDLKNIIKAFSFASKNLPKNLKINSGLLSFETTVKGKLFETAPRINALITNFAADENVYGLQFRASKILTKATANFEKQKGVIEITNADFSAKNMSNNAKKLHADLIKFSLDNSDFVINPSKLTTGNGNIILSGQVKDYLNKPNLNIQLNGTLDTSLLKQFIPSYITVFNKGYLPVRVIFGGSVDNISGNVLILANDANYLSPLKLNNIVGNNSLTNLIFTFNGKDFVINELALYKADNISSLQKTVNFQNLKKLINVKGKIRNIGSKNISFENLKIVSKDVLNVSLGEFGFSKNAFADMFFDLTLNGNINAPNILGFINIQKLQAPEYSLEVNNLLLNLNKKNINLKAQSINLKNNTLSLSAAFQTDIFSTAKIDSIKVNATYLDLDSLFVLFPLLQQSKYAPGVEFPYTINSGKISVNSFKSGLLRAENVIADISSKNNNLFLKNISANAYGGKVAGNIVYDFPYSSIEADLQGRSMSSSAAAVALMPKEHHISGDLNFDANIKMYGITPEQQAKTLRGNADVVIRNGHLGQLGRFEHFLYAQNLISQKLIYASLNSAKQAISPKNTGQFTYLKGKIAFKNGYMHFNPVLTAGANMSMYITGYIGLLDNFANLNILGKVSSEVSNSMGILGNLTIKSFLDEHTKYGQTIAKLFNFYNSELPEVDISKIPNLNPDLKYQTKNFKVLISGKSDSVTSVKSFTWVNPIGTNEKFEKLTGTTDSLKNDIVEPNAKATTIEYSSKQQVKSDDNILEQSVTPKINNLDFLDNIPDTFN